MAKPSDVRDGTAMVLAIFSLLCDGEAIILPWQHIYTDLSISSRGTFIFVQP